MTISGRLFFTALYYFELVYSEEIIVFYVVKIYYPRNVVFYFPVFLFILHAYPVKEIFMELLVVGDKVRA